MKLTSKSWSPYVAGSGIGILIWLTILFLNKNIGNSNALVSLAGLIKSLFVPAESIQGSEYYTKYMIDQPIFGFQATIIIGILLGAFVAAKLSKSTFNFVPSIWENNFGKSKVARAIAACFGGILVAFGARMADGCMSGLGLSSGIKLATVSWLFIPAVFVAAVIIAFILYKKWEEK